MRLVVAGSPAAAVPTLRRLAASDHEIVAVLTRPATPQGRKRVLTPTPVAVVAAELGLPVIEASRVDDAVTARIADLDVDLGVIVAYGALLRRPALDAPRHGWINLHFSDLPAYRGAAPVQRAVMAGDTRTAATVFQLVEALDAGPVYAAPPFEIDPEATSGEVLAAMAEVGADVVADVVDAIADGTAVATEQSGEPTVAPKLTIDDGRIDFAAPATVVHARLRGVTPEPGAYAHLGETRVKLLRSRTEPGGTQDPAPSLAPGALALHGGRLLVGTADTPLVLLEVQPAGKKAMDAAAWARGLGELDGKVLA
ncbi:methionyl-tRNA formyltransferase [Curtobacterium flaccumfaciens]|uniref:methionyl-tRNA formyltransferase n=1 Tax=Curtobacterium flaccumfaciens TaxID=2035 RepID=UPI001BDDFF3B|nr:methionyl-tRNA formyltransferase [Curtobacterium flaccumfaciens]MBT1605767.1 methionyl-tRNA formyltransferase [Curtobacterium flaccumfaciens pv. betae]MBT1655371.1 methionyl-tRNA formyltransferase [Curtobacterium flaccumfaciens pv. betae]MCS0469548.1 methionyl-tRNA formyltransferase [Curtobacterium flaccumfaciens pv. betae]MCS0474497.1 methionyl-tRNA formyltransferase [Curtobacterium flaccumfaciens pv. betae]MCS0476396.1 methionyl-tRNA formyltransferase [Curtobacterium flaccumfaciens pv. be